MGASRDWARMKQLERMRAKDAADERAFREKEALKARVAQLEEIVRDLENDLFQRDERIEAMRRQLARPHTTPTPAQFSRVRDYTEEA